MSYTVQGDPQSDASGNPTSYTVRPVLTGGMSIFNIVHPSMAAGLNQNENEYNIPYADHNHLYACAEAMVKGTL